LPIVVIERAAEAFREGNSEAAQEMYEGLPVERLAASEAAQTRFGLAQSLLEQEDYVGAVRALRTFLNEHRDHALVADAHFLLAEALLGAGEYLEAAEAYRAYLDQREVIAPYVQTWIGDAYTLVGAHEEGVEAYEEALTEAPTRNLIFQVREKLALTLNYAGDTAGAVAQYDAILATAEDGDLRARIQYQAAQALLGAGERQAAHTRLYDLVRNYYKTPAAYSALVDLVNSGEPVDDFQRGRVDYYNDAPDAAIAAFYRAIEADLEGHPGVPHYYAGLAYRDEGNYAGAIIEFDKLIDTHPGDPYVDDAWLAKAWTQYRDGEADAAVETYTSFVAERPFNGLAPEALWWAANIRFWSDDFAQAEGLFAQLAADYPADEYAADALYRAAICRYRLGNYTEAVETWRRYTARYPAGELAIGAQFWRGRAYLAAGETISATAAFTQAVEAGPLDYYSQRALDYLVGLVGSGATAPGAAEDGSAGDRSREPFLQRPFQLDAAQPDEGPDKVFAQAIERAAADGWLAGWLGLSQTEAVTVSQLSPALAADPRLLRGQELWRLGHRAEAKEELEWLRRDTATDLRAQYQLSIFFRDLGLFRSSILAANAAIRLSPARSPFDAPPFLAKLAYPTYYADLVLSEAEANDLDPLLVFSLIRQESLFEGFATSYAFAHGLMQIIPATGQSIANSLGWPGYETSDLYRPYVSVKFGSWYLGRQRDTFDGLIYPALAAYNAGPGNGQRWLERVLAGCSEDEASEACPFDYDLYVEIINLSETRLYLRQIYKHYAVYQYLYGEE
jgi:soluble lytic murein transglycosylase